MSSWRGLLVAALAVALAAWDGADAMCVMTQKCVNPGNIPDYEACMPEANPTPVAPKPMRGDGWANVTGGGACSSDDDCHGKGACTQSKCVCHNDGMAAGPHCNEFLIQCPEYKDSACCTWQQNQGMAENFKLLSTVFGTVGGGCDACAANLMHLWCGFVCSPRQAEFMRMHSAYPSTNYRPDPMTGEDHVKVLELDVTLAKSFTCALFESCKNTAIASMSEALKSSLGFLNYQAQTGAIGHGEFMFLSFNDRSNATAFDHHVYKCDNYSEVDTPAIKAALPTQATLLPSIASSVPKQCPCGACHATCDAHTSSSNTTIHVVDNPISVWDGFNGKLVGIVYAIAIAFVIALRFKQDD